MSITSCPAPIIVRIAGLPCDVMEAFSSRCGECLDVLGDIQTQLQKVRVELVNCLHAGIHNAKPAKRHALLAVKRDCYNGRPLAAYRFAPAWCFVEETAAELANHALELERQVVALQREFVSLFEAETSRQYGWLAGFSQDPMFRCGLTAANPKLAGECSRLREIAPELYTRKEHRLATTLLRYLSRATLKLSPFSTFTPVGLARLENGGAAPALAAGPWCIRSLVRVRRHILDRCADLLLCYPPWRRRLRVAVNDSVVELPDGRVLFRQPSHYRQREDLKFQFHEESLVRARLQGPFMEQLIAACTLKEVSYQDLVHLLSNRLVTVPQTDIEHEIDRLIGIGFLQLLPPWTCDDAHLEKTLVAELRLLPGTPALQKLVANLEQLVTGEESVLYAADPRVAFDEMTRLVEIIIQSTAELAGKRANDVAVRTEREIYHDVWCTPEIDSGRALLRVGRDPLDQAFRSVEPLVRYARLYDHQLDLLYSFGAILQQKRGPACTLPVLEAFHAGQPLWQAFMKQQVHARDTEEEWRYTWNPCGVPDLEELAAARETAHTGLQSCLVEGPEGQRIELEQLNELLGGIPERFTEGHGGACLFLQPASTDGSLWMLNRMKEGTARFASRYTSIMPATLREQYSDELMRRGTFQIAGEPVELLDVYCVQGDTLNVHAPQTPKILTLPGVELDIPPHRRRRLRDLVIAVGSDGIPQLRDREGQRYLPVHLGVCYHDYLPTLVKFLCAFGPSEMGAVFPTPLKREIEGMTVQERTVIGNVILHRKTWQIPMAELRRNFDRRTPHEAFAVVRGWCKRRGIPERVFVTERVPHPILGFRYQPQYLDLTSPVFMPILRSVIASPDEMLHLVEAVPSPEMFPKDSKGQAWSVELLLDSLCLRQPDPPRSVRVREVNTIERKIRSLGPECPVDLERSERDREREHCSTALLHR